MVGGTGMLYVTVAPNLPTIPVPPMNQKHDCPKWHWPKVRHLLCVCEYMRLFSHALSYRRRVICNPMMLNPHSNLQNEKFCGWSKQKKSGEPNKTHTPHTKHHTKCKPLRVHLGHINKWKVFSPLCLGNKLERGRCYARICCLCHKYTCIEYIRRVNMYFRPEWHSESTACSIALGPVVFMLLRCISCLMADTCTMYIHRLMHDQLICIYYSRNSLFSSLLRSVESISVGRPNADQK